MAQREVPAQRRERFMSSTPIHSAGRSISYTDVRNATDTFWKRALKCGCRRSSGGVRREVPAQRWSWSTPSTAIHPAGEQVACSDA